MSALVLLPAALAAAPVAAPVPVVPATLAEAPAPAADLLALATPVDLRHAAPHVIRIVAPAQGGQGGTAGAGADTAQPVPAPAPDAAAPAPDDQPDIAAPAADRDPLEGLNRAMFGAFQVVDRIVYRPVSVVYRTVVPHPVRRGLHNFLTNLSEPIVFLNDLLQLKFARALRTFERFTINTVLGIGGIIDVAKGEGLPHRDNGLGNTLAYYGVGPGPYIFLPILGPTTLRDLLGSAGDSAALPTTIGKPFDRGDYQLASGIVGGLDQRVEQDGEMKALLDGAVDPYATLRSAYLQNRAAQVRALHGKGDGSDDALSDPLADPLSDPAPDPAPQP